MCTFSYYRTQHKYLARWENIQLSGESAIITSRIQLVPIWSECKWSARNDVKSQIVSFSDGLRKAHFHKQCILMDIFIIVKISNLKKTLKYMFDKINSYILNTCKRYCSPQQPYFVQFVITYIKQLSIKATKFIYLKSMKWRKLILFVWIICTILALKTDPLIVRFSSYNFYAFGDNFFSSKSY